MKVLQVNVVYKFGSTGKIVYDLHTLYIERGIESIVCYGRGKKVNERHIYKLAPEIIMKLQSLYSKITGYQYKGCWWSTRNLIRIIKVQKPEIVHLQCVNANTVDIYKTIAFLKKHDIPAMITHHAEFMFTGGCAHAFDCERWKTGCYKCPQRGNKKISFFFDRSKEQWNMLKESYTNFNSVVITCVSGWLRDRALQSPFFKDKRIEVVYNGLDTSVFHPLNAEKLRLKHGLNGNKIILHVTPNFLHPLKGGDYVIQLARRFETLDPAIKFMILGFKGDNKKLPSNIIPLDFTEDQTELARYYSLANVTLITSSKETFSMVSAESLCCGTPVAGFIAGGPESITIPEFSSFVEYGNTDELQKAVLELINLKEEKGKSISSKALIIYSKEKMADRYIEIYTSLRN